MRLSTARLRLVAPDAELEALAGGDPAALERALGAVAAPDWPPKFVGEALGRWRETLMKAPGFQGWTAWYWLSCERGAPPQLVGYGGFRGAPEDGEVELDFALVGSAQGRGLATEACSALVVWASRDPRVERIVAHTLPEFSAARRVLEKLGFQRRGPQEVQLPMRYELELG